MAVMELVSTKSFQHLWRELRKFGWAAKKPGEDALMAFAARHGLLRMDVVITQAMVDRALANPFASSTARAAPVASPSASATPPPSASVTPPPTSAATLPPPAATRTSSSAAAAPPPTAATATSPPAATAATPPPAAATTPSASAPPSSVVTTAATAATTTPSSATAITPSNAADTTPSIATAPRPDATATPTPSTTSVPTVVPTAAASSRADGKQRRRKVPRHESTTHIGTAQAASTAQASSTAQADTAEDLSTAQATAHDTAQSEDAAYDTSAFLQAMQQEDYFRDVDQDDVNLTSEAEDDQDSDVEGVEDVDMLFDVYDDDEIGGDVDEDDAEGTIDVERRDTLRDMSVSGWNVFNENISNTCVLDAASDYFVGKPRHTKSAHAFADSPLGLFFYFLPKVLWVRIAEETNRYRSQSLESLATQRQQQQRLRQAKDPNVTVQSLQDIRDELAKWKPVQPHEILHFIALLLARSMSPQRIALARHWALHEEGAVPRGTFGRFMTRKWFEDIVRFLHFNNNEDNRRREDRAWKVRPVLQVVEKTFRRGFLLGKTISFDEGMVGSRHRMNPMRVYMKGKPTKWGTKFYMTCCAETAYCAHVEICCGADDSDNTVTRAVLRNVSKTLHGQPAGRLIVTDSYYSSVTLSQELLKRNMYHVGTYRMNRLGWPKDFSYNFSTRPKKIPRGTYRIAVNKTIPEMVAVSWCDSRSVQIIATGCSTKQTTVRRREKNGSFPDVVCPQVVVDYQTGMGGVDQHDQLRLQRYSIQKSVRTQNYYKGVFLGIVDMTIVNGYVVHRFEKRAKGENVPTHADYVMHLHQELLAVTKLDLASHLVAENLVSAPVAATQHALTQTTELYKGKLRQYLCKVCSALSDKEHRSAESSYFCEACTRERGGGVWLCNKVRPGQTLTCSQIWHDTWKNGTLIPAHLRKRIRFAKRKRAAEDDEGSSGDS